MASRRYENLDGIRALFAIGIVLMHIRANGQFGITGFLYDNAISSFTNLTFFFMLLSAFSMCCGYYEKFQNNTVDLEQFYKRRYQRIWPFFALLCTVELIVDHSLKSLYEWFADLTLAFGLIPHNGIEVVGVGWFLGTVFVFYMLFPFFTVLLRNKKRAWLTMALCLVLHVLCIVRFEDAATRSNIIYSSVFFVAGGLLYLYSDKINELAKYRWCAIIATLAILVFYYVVNSSDLVLLMLFTLLTILGITGGKVLRFIFQNKVIRFLASLSMEIYLCHMFVFRVIEKMHLLHISGNEILNYTAVCIATIGGAIVMSLVLKKIIAFAESKLQKAQIGDKA